MGIQVNVCAVGIAFLICASLTLQDGAHNFSYTGATGPDRWGRLSPEFSLCSKGKVQSPVNIVTKDVIHNPELQRLNRDYGMSNSTLVNHAYTIMLEYGSDEAGLLIQDDKNYTLKQIHWHSPSEHTIDGVRFPLELHLVHVAKDGNISVVGILYDYGKPDILLLLLKKQLEELASNGTKDSENAHIAIGSMGPLYLGRDSYKYYKYVGSLTTPPCKENVKWNVLAEVRHVSKEQIDALKAPLDESSKSNSRPVQPLNGRKIDLCDVKN